MRTFERWMQLLGSRALTLWLVWAGSTPSYGQTRSDLGEAIEFLQGDDAPAVDGEVSELNVWHYNTGAEIALLPPGRSPWSLTADLGVGASTLDFEDAETTDTHLTTNGGLKIGYGVSRMLDLYVGGDAYLMFTDEETLGFDTAWSFPVSAGWKLRFP